MGKVGQVLTLKAGKKEVKFTVRAKESANLTEEGEAQPEPEAEGSVPSTPPSSNSSVSDAQATEMAELRKQMSQMQALLIESVRPRQDEGNRISELLRGAGLTEK